eukprot:8162733-Pyramimonas_sp.AAC.1
MDQSDAGRVGIFSHGPIGRRTRRYILTTDQSDAGHTGNITSFYGLSCANNGKDALNTPEQHTQ